jgi:hypothetical protein
MFNHRYMPISRLHVGPCRLRNPSSDCANCARDFVRQRKAASDLACAGNNVKVEQINDGNWKATGCIQSASYVCSGSNFMSSGMCMREGTLPTSATMSK